MPGISRASYMYYLPNQHVPVKYMLVRRKCCAGVMYARVHTTYAVIESKQTLAYTRFVVQPLVSLRLRMRCRNGVR